MCSAHGVPDLPAFAEDLAAYLAEQATSQAMNTVRTAISQAGIPGSTPPDGPGWAASRMASRAKAVTATPSASRATSRKNAPHLGAGRHEACSPPLGAYAASLSRAGFAAGFAPARENPEIKHRGDNMNINPLDFPEHRRRDPKRRAEAKVYGELAGSDAPGYVLYEVKPRSDAPECDFAI